jgi:Leucine-rich repeat (LRR) protein
MLPRTLEYLNYSGNCLKRLNKDVTQRLTKLTTLDVNGNGLENLDGVENLRCLSRLQARNNQI